MRGEKVGLFHVLHKTISGNQGRVSAKGRGWGLVEVLLAFQAYSRVISGHWV